MFYYIGNTRLQLCFDTPNVCASFLVMSVFLLLGAYLYLVEGKYDVAGRVLLERIGNCILGKLTSRRLVLLPQARCLCYIHLFRRFISFLLLLLVVIGEYLLALTYSRGGYIAFLVGLLVIWLLNRRKRILFLTLTFLLILFAVSNGTERFSSVVQTSDGSIQNRLILWKGGMMLAADHWASGVGVERIGGLFSAWYQPVDRNESYNTLVNDYLTICAGYGIFALFGYLFFVFTVLWLGFRLWRLNRNSLLSGMLAAQVAYLLSAVFSTFYNDKNIYYIFILLQMATIIWIIGSVVFQKYRLKTSEFVVPILMSAGICGMILSCGLFMTEKLPCSYAYKSYHDGLKAIEVVEAFPRNKTPKAIVLYTFNSEQIGIEREAKLTIRPLVEKGYRVIASGIDSGFQGLKDEMFLIRKVIEDNAGGNDVFIGGQGDGGRLAIIAASKMDDGKIMGVFSIGSNADWPFEELSPAAHVKNLKVPLLLIHGGKDTKVYFGESERLKNLSADNKVNVESEIITGADHYLLGKRDYAIRSIDDFINKKLNKSNSDDKSLKLQVFVRAGCRYCARLKKVLLDAGRKYGDKVSVTYHDISGNNERIRYEAYRILYDIDEGATTVPAVFMSDRFLVGKKSIWGVDNEISQALKHEEISATKVPTVEEIRNAEDVLTRRFERISYPAVIFAGLIDGINPCVFSTLIFLMSLLTVSGVSGNKLLAVGSIYCFACFLSYLALGLGIFGFIRLFTGLEYLRFALELSMALLLLFLAVISFIDAWKYRKSHDEKDVKLKLPKLLKNIIHKLLKSGLNSGWLMPGIFVTGVIVTLLESVCTGQVYVPTMALLANNSLAGKWFFFLVLYNVMFIIPLIVVFMAVYSGIDKFKLIEWSRKDVVAGKIAMGCLFLFLDILLLVSMWS
ncbi:MAG: alpha/beta family hydrolase [Victivallales bacterium]